MRGLSNHLHPAGSLIMSWKPRGNKVQGKRYRNVTKG